MWGHRRNMKILYNKKKEYFLCDIPGGECFKFKDRDGVYLMNEDEDTYTSLSTGRIFKIDSYQVPVLKLNVELRVLD